MLGIIGGIFWTITYIIIIIKGFKDKTWGMPIVALCANISWEFIFSFLHPHSFIPYQLLINICWLCFDVVILYQYLRYGIKEFTPGKKLFYPSFLLTLATAFFTVLFVTYEFNDWYGMYTAFGSNFMMSILFINMLIVRSNTRGQSLYVGISKMLGILVWDIILYRFNSESILLIFFYVTIFVFDLIYLAMLLRQFKREGKNPWTGKQLL